MRSKLARWLAAASLLVLVTTPALAASKSSGSSSSSSSTAGKGWLGVSTQPTDADLKKGLDLTQDGLLVNQVTSDSPADRAGLKKGDVILSYNSRSVTTPEQLRDLVRNTAPGRSVALGLWRDGARKSVDVKVGDVADSGDEDSFDAPVPPTPPEPPSPPSPRSSTRIERNDDGDVRMWVDGKELTDDEIKDKLKDMKVKMKALDGDSWNWDDGGNMHMNVAPMAMAVKPARLAAILSPAPAASPTRTVAARPIPSGIMKVREGMVMAIWCAASVATPNVPIARAAALNSATSKTMVTPMGRPKWNSSAKQPHAGCQSRCRMR